MIFIPFCPSCGKNVDAGKRFCENCGAPLAPTPAPQPAAPPAPPAPAAAPPAAPAGQASGQQKSAGLAALASFLFTGLGQVYNGNLGRGLMIFFGTIIGALFFTIPGIIVWLYGIYDAYTTANKMNAGQIPFVPHNTMHIIAFIVIGIIVIIIYFIVIAAAMAAMMGTSSHYYY